MKTSTIITWILIGAVIWELDKQRTCSCQTQENATPGHCNVPTTTPATSSEAIPNWIVALGGL